MAKGRTAFGRYLRARRTKAGLSIRDVAQRIDLSHVFLSNVERGVQAPLQPKHWPGLIRTIAGVTHLELEKYAAADRPVALALDEAPAEYTDLGLALARRIRDRDLAAADIGALLEILDQSGAPPKRAHGRVLDRDGRPVEGKAFLYRLSSSAVWSGLVGAREHAGQSSGPLIARGARELGKSIDLMRRNHPRGEGFFDVPGGLPPGEYALDVHHHGQRQWAWPLIVTDGAEPQDLWIGGPTPTGDATPEAAPASERRARAGTAAPPRR